MSQKYSEMVSFRACCDVVFSADQNYATPLMLSVYSYCRKNPNSGSIHVLTDGLDTETCRKLKMISEYNGNLIFIHEISNEYIKDLSLNISYISKATYYRYFIGDILRDKSSVLYLDVDILINSSLSELMKVDLGNYYAAGVWDRCVANFQDRKYLDALGNEGLKKTYLNAGVLLLNLNKLRSEKMSKVFLKNHKKLEDRMKFQDQDVLNYSFGTEVVLLDKKNNLMTYERERHPIVTRFMTPSIIHFTGDKKPWKSDCGYWGRKYRAEQRRMESFLENR